MRLKHKYDVVVIGAGSTGSSIAYYLVRKGLRDVLLLDKGLIGQGMTGRSTGIIRLHYSDARLMEMAIYSWNVLRRFHEIVGGETVFSKVGFMLGGGEEDVDVISEVLTRQKKAGINVKLMTPEEAAEVFPSMRTEGLSVVAYEPDSGYANTVDVAQGFARAAVDLGAHVYENTEVLGFETYENRILKVKTSRGEVAAEHVVNATGVWTLSIAEMLEISLPVSLGRDDILVLERPQEQHGQHPVWGDLPLGFYMRPEGTYRTLMGALDAVEATLPPDALGYNIPFETIEWYSRMITARFPGYSEAKPSGGWPGYYDITPDWQPIVGFDLKYENLVHCVGLSGHGFKLAPAFGEIVSDLILHGESKKFDVEVFNVERFREGEREGSRYKYKIIG